MPGNNVAKGFFDSDNLSHHDRQLGASWTDVALQQM
jgi:hypothetical protein